MFPFIISEVAVYSPFPAACFPIFTFMFPYTTSPFEPPYKFPCMVPPRTFIVAVPLLVADPIGALSPPPYTLFAMFAVLCRVMFEFVVIPPWLPPPYTLSNDAFMSMLAFSTVPADFGPP